MLKIKTRKSLSRVERVALPHVKLGPIYLVWWGRAAERLIRKQNARSFRRL